MPTIDEKIAGIQSAIAAQESLRATLGDAVVEVTLTALRAQLESLRAEQTNAGSAQAQLTPQALLAQLQGYIPKQLADKMRSAGQISGERRQVTVLFADISGFTSMSERLDPEDVHAVVNDCLKELVQAVYQYEGMVDKFVGDCVMAVFGAPIALEDDAERALRAALAMRESLQGINRRWIDRLGKPLDFHIGAHTGEVIAGNVGNDLRMSYTVLGDTVNLAARLQDAAKAGQIFVSEKTYQMTRGLFEFKKKSPMQVKGKKDPVQVYEVMHARIQPSKTRGIEGLASPLIGRDRERDALQKVMADLKGGAGGIVMLLGEAGIGKSRLLAEIRPAGGDEATWLAGHCFAYNRSLSYGPFLDLLRRFSAITDEDSEQGASAKLRARLAEILPGDKRAYVVLAQLLSMSLEREEAALAKSDTPEAFRKALFSVMENFLLALAAKQPVMLVFEDLHWADLSSIELVSHLFSLTGRAPISIMALCRSKQEASGSWKALAPALEAHRDRYTEISLQPLTGLSIRQLVDGLLNSDALPQKLCDAIIEKAEGNPFFIEEMLRSLIERGILVREPSGWKVTELIHKIQVPDTLQGLLLSRLDRLPEQTRQIVQKAAVVGRVFLYRVLQEIAREDDALESQIALIENAELVREHSRLPEIEYVFKHALTQEVAYKTLLSPARKYLHQRVGQAMEAIFGQRIEEFTGILAFHYVNGEAWEKALEYSTRAGDRAARLYAYSESREHYHHAIECLRHLPDEPENQRKKVDLILHLVNVSLQSAAPEQNLALLVEAEKIAAVLNDRLRAARVQLFMGRVHYLAGRLPEAIGHFQKVLAVAGDLKDPELLCLPGAVLGKVLFIQGHFLKAQRLLEQVVPLLEAAKNYHELLFAYIYRGGARTALGDFAAGSADIEGALKLARAAHNPNAETMAQTGFALIRLIAGRYAEGIACAHEALAIAEKTGDAMFRYSSNSFIAWGHAGLGDFAKADQHWAAAREAAKPLGGRLLLGEWFAAVESETWLEKGDVEVAIKKGEEALGMAKATGSVIAEGLSELALGRAWTRRAGWQEADNHLGRSAALLANIGAKFDLTRATLAVAELAAARGEKDKASELLEKTIAAGAECGLERESAAARSLLASL